MKGSKFFSQVELLLRILPVVARQKVFALKGGTAINLFYRDMPRLSVDIDLVYLPIEDRKSTFKNLTSAMEEIHREIERLINAVTVREHRIRENNTITRLIVEGPTTAIKVEPNTVLRGSVYPVEMLTTVPSVTETFGTSVTAPLLSRAEVYAGKLCAALDRQHPRDLFDVKVLFDNEGITDEIRKAFVVYLVSHNRPMDELLRPHLLDKRELFETEFRTMTSAEVSYSQLEKARKKLTTFLGDNLTEAERRFVLSIARGEPEWELLEFEHLADLPAIQWKLLNVRKMDRKKRDSASEKVRGVLGL